MVQKSPKKAELKKRLRIKGGVEAPNLPDLEREDFIPHLWKAIQLPHWNIEQASHFLHHVVPGDLLSSDVKNKIERTYFWLKKEYEEKGWAADLLKTPGDIMRLLWEAGRKSDVSLKVWKLYDLYDKGEVDYRIEAHVLANNYRQAGNIVWREYNDASTEEVVEVLSELPRQVRDVQGLPLFASRSKQTIEKYIKREAHLERGRRPSEKKPKIDIDYLIDLIKKEMGI